MAVLGERITVTDQPTLLAEAPAGDPIPGISFALINLGSVDVDLSDHTAVAGAAFPIAAGGKMACDLQQGESVYGIAPTGQSAVVAVFRTGI